MKVQLSLAVALAAVGGLAATSHAALVYQNTFAGGSGVPSTTPGGGTITVRQGTDGTTTNTGTLTATGGIDGNGAYTSNNSYAFAAGSSVAATSNTGGSAITGLPASFGQFTVSFWVRTPGTANDGTGVSTPNQFGRLIILGTSGTADQGVNSLGIEFRGGQLDVNVNNNSRQSVGAVLAANVWNFVSFTYDGTSASSFNSPSQNTATGFASSVNGQLYEGTDTAAVTRYAASLNTAAAADANSPTFTANAGPIALGAASTLLVGNRSDLGRGTNGIFDDVRIYDSILTPAQVDAVRTSALPAAAAPEPTTLAAVAGGAIALLRRRRRSI